jgi:hypothetical protein
VQAVFGGDLEIDVIEGLSALVDKSLVRHESRPDGASRFSLLESLREFGRGQLATTGELETIQHRHAAYFVALVHQAEVHKRGIRQSTWLETLEREHANIQGALGWCLDGGNVALGLQGATALSWFWDLRGHWSIGRRWLERLLNAYSTTHDSLRAKGLCALGYLLWHQAEFEQAQVVFEESLAMYRRLGETIGIINALYSLSLRFSGAKSTRKLMRLSKRAWRCLAGSTMRPGSPKVSCVSAMSPSIEGSSKRGQHGCGTPSGSHRSMGLRATVGSSCIASGGRDSGRVSWIARPPSLTSAWRSSTS